MKTAAWTLPLFLMAACVKQSAINISYDLGKIHRVAVIPFPSTPAGIYGPENLFAKHLLDQGYQVVERSRLDALVKELNLGMQGYLPAAEAKRIGQILGVDALLIGEITSYSPERKSVITVESETRVEEPVLKVVRERKTDGTFQDVLRQVGTKVSHERKQTPQTFIIDAQVGVVAKLVDVETGELIWAGSDNAEAVNPHLALDQTASTLARKLKKQWEAAEKARASSK